jgi:hypothetical protein
MTPCSLVGGNLSFGGIYCLLLLLWTYFVRSATMVVLETSYKSLDRSTGAICLVLEVNFQFQRMNWRQMVDMVTYSKGNLWVFKNKVIVNTLDLRLDFWDVMMTNLTDGYQCFRGILPQDRAFNPEGVGTMLLQNSAYHLPDYTTSHPIRPQPWLVLVCNLFLFAASRELCVDSSSIYPCILNVSRTALPLLLHTVTPHLTKIHKQFLYFILNVLI